MFRPKVRGETKSFSGYRKVIKGKFASVKNDEHYFFNEYVKIVNIGLMFLYLVCVKSFNFINFFSINRVQGTISYIMCSLVLHNV